MIMKEVTSDNISRVGYENETLYIVFNRGRTYSYSGVPERFYQGLVNARSCGDYFAQNIRGKYPYKRID